MATTPTTPATSDPRNTPIASGKRQILITAAQVQPPSPLYLQPEDSLFFGVYSPTFAGPFTLTLTIRWLRPDGEIVSVKRTLNCALGLTSLTFTLGEGFMLSATVANPNPIMKSPGTVWVELYVIRNTPETPPFLWALINDYITNLHSPSWPFGRITSPQEGPGRVRSITGTTPALGAEISEVVPFDVRWSLQAFRISLLTSAVAGNRNIKFIIDDGVNVLFQCDGNLTVTASQSAQTTLSNTGFINAAVAINTGLAPLAPMFLGAGFRIRTLTQGKDAGDQYSAPQYLVQEWIDS
jgi:hypothetical protein